MEKGELRGEGGSLYHVFSAGSPKLEMPEKPEINPQEPKDIIEYKERVFEVHPAWIFYLSDIPENLKGRIELTTSRGMSMMYDDGVYGCHYCNHAGFNLADMFAQISEDCQTAVIDDSQSRCMYEPTNVMRASACFNSRDGFAFMVLRDSCVVYDSTIEYLAEKGLLDEFEVDREFDFVSLENLIENPDLFEKYKIHVPESYFDENSNNLDSEKLGNNKRKDNPGFFRRIFNYFSNHFFKN